MEKIDVAKVVEALLHDIEIDLYMSIHDIDEFSDVPWIAFKLWDHYVFADENGLDFIEPDEVSMKKVLESKGYSVYKVENLEG